MQKYVAVPRNDVSGIAENSWFATCREKTIPFITLKARTKFADVQWDYISYPTHVDSVLESQGVYIRNSAIAIFKKYANAKSKYTASGHVVWYQNLEVSKAKLAASELYDLIDSWVETA